MSVVEGIPERMKGVTIEQYGPASVLNVRDDVGVAIAIDPNEIMVKTEAASVNPVDWKLRSGRLSKFWKLSFPTLLGLDFAGRIVATGKRVTGFAVGDEVFGKLSSLSIEKGAYSEYIRVDTSSDCVCRKPENLTMEEAASLPLAGLTAYQSVAIRGLVKKGQKVLIIGASGGVGTLAVQIAKSLGAYVTATCSERNIELVKSLGADEVLDYTEKSYADELAGKEYDCIVDIVGSPNIYENSQRILKKNTGILVSTLGEFGKYEEVSVGSMLKSVGSFWKKRANYYLYGQPFQYAITNLNKEYITTIAAMVRKGDLKPVIDKTYTLAEIKDAHIYSESSRARGKIIIKI
eukprot:Nk52_evm9s243 gene=Nk52_evmTU9s243